jgi:hypothetical protein
MAKKVFSGGMLLLAMTFGLVLSGCTSVNNASAKEPNFEKKPLSAAGSPKYTVLGTVVLEKDWYGVLGFSNPKLMIIPAGDHYIFQDGCITYVELLEKAREQYPDADAVFDINIDYRGDRFFSFFYSKRTNIASGIAVKYSREEVGGGSAASSGVK